MSRAVARRFRANQILSVGAVGTLLASAIAGAASPAQAAESYPRPADSVLTISGHGFGHGHGMSQWGAYGAAKVGRLSWQSIVGFYYPGTTLANLGNSTIRVRLDAVGSGELDVFSAPGLRLDGSVLPGMTSGITQYRARPLPAKGKLGMDALTAAGWKPYPSSASPAVFSSAATFSNISSGVLDVRLADGTRRTYRGSISAGWASSVSLTPVNSLPIETYLRAVVPAEMPASWHPNALAAQAVAARSYANYDRAHAPAGRSWDTCDTTRCQMYSGVPAEHGTSDVAVAATAGQTLTYGGTAAFTQFGAANGGWTAAGSQPYLTARADPYDGAIPNNANAWTSSVSASRIQARWPSIGTYRQLRITSRDGHGQWGGRVLTAAVDGSAGTVNITGTDFQWSFGLRSEWFIPTNVTSAPVPPVVAPPVPPVVAPPVAPWAATRYTAVKGVVLHRASREAAVAVLQRGLRVTADGDFGPQTRAALVTFQTRQHLSPDGVTNRLVWDRLEKRDYPLIAYRGHVLRQGSSGAVTVVIQRALRVGADGAFGPKTAAAVRAVQSGAKITPTGVVSGWTWVAIENRMPRS